MNKNSYRLIPMNMNEYNINDLLKEEADTGVVLWKNGNEEGKNAQKILPNDIIYIYCTNLTDGSKRILFRAIVDSVDDEKTYSFDKKLKIKGIYLKNIKAVSLLDKYKYNRNNLLDKYNIFVNQTKQMLATFNDYNTYKNNSKAITKDRYGFTDKLSVDKYKNRLLLIDELEKEYLNKKYSLKDTNAYFNDNTLCECCQLLGFSKKEAQNRTFRKTNGFLYYEVHHLLMQNILRMKNDEWFNSNNWYNKSTDFNIILSEFNEINLCPVCHREFHYGNFIYQNKNGINNKKDLIIKLMESHNYNHKLKTLGKSNEEISEITNYIINQYTNI